MSHPSIGVQSFDKGYIVRPAGRIGGPEGETLDSELERLVGLKPTYIVMDMSGTEMLSSRAISALIRLHKRLKEAGGKARLAAVPPAVMSVLALAKLDDYIPVFLTVDEAKR
jgi:anti-anti-sigma factor